MYKNEFQGGPAVDVFGANGKDPLNKWKNPAVHRIYEKEAKGYVYSLEGSTATAKLSFPVKEQFRQNLCLIQRYLVLQVYIPMSKDFAVELNMSDINNNKRRVLMSTSAKDISLSPLHAKLPLSVVKRDTWLNLCFDLVSLISDVFTSQTYKSLDSFALQGNLKVRRVFTLKDQPRDTTTTSEDPNNYGVRHESIPISLQFSSAVSFETQVINVGVIRQRLGARSARSERDTSGYWSSSSEELGSSRRFSARDKLPTHIAFGTKVPFERNRSSRSKSGSTSSRRDPNLPESSSEGLGFRKTMSGNARLSGRSHSNEKLNPRGPMIVPRITKHKVRSINDELAKKKMTSPHLDSDLPTSLLSLVDAVEDFVPEEDQTLTCFTFSSHPHSVPRLRTESARSQNDKEHDFIRSSSSSDEDIRETPSPKSSRLHPVMSSRTHLSQPQSSLSPDISRLQSPPPRIYIHSNYSDPPPDPSLSQKPPLSRKSLRSSDATLTASMDTLVQHSSIFSCEDFGVPPVANGDDESLALNSSQEKPLNSSTQSVVLKRKNIKSIPNPTLTLPESSGFQVGTWSESYEAEMLQSMKRENEEEMRREEEGRRLGVVADFTDSMDESFGASWSTYNPPPMPLQAYEDEMSNDPTTLNNNSLLDCSNPRDWADMFSPPTVLPSVRARQNKESLSGSDSMGNDFDIMGLSDGSSTASMKSSATTDAEEEEMLELMFDPCLNCYFDPKTGKYYELRN